ncbi:MAG: tetratricopeptide repeat protein [Candidatus Riflebacteria bacterium]|nr:tetratricopeptide repeat protein [Candidatus Riflebacteria bacterium]
MESGKNTVMILFRLVFCFVLLVFQPFSDTSLFASELSADFPVSELETGNFDYDMALEHYEEGYRLYRRGDFSAAEVQLKKSLELEPNLLKAHYWLGKLLRERGRLSEAIHHWEEVSRLERLIKDRREALQYSNNEYPALSQIQKTLEMEKKAKESFLKAKSLMEEGFWDGAVAEIKQAVELYPKNPDYLLLMSRLLKDRGDLNGSLKACQELLEIPSLPREIFLEAITELEKNGRKKFVTHVLRNYDSLPITEVEKNERILGLSEKKNPEPVSAGKIISINGSQVIIDIGMQEGLKLADEYALEIRSFKSGVVISDNVSERPAGREVDRLSGELLVTKVFLNSAWAIIRKEFGEGVKVGDLIEIAQGSRR